MPARQNVAGLLPNGGITAPVAKVVRVMAAREVAKALVNQPELRGLPARELAARLGVTPPVAQAGIAALLRHIAPTAPAFPAGASLDVGAMWTGAAAAPVPDAKVPLVAPAASPPPFRPLTPAAAAKLPLVVPGLRGADRRFLGLAARGRTSRPHVRLVLGHGVQGLEGAKYRVEPGDYYAKIAGKLGHPNEVPALIKANPQVPSPYNIFPNQLLSLPDAWLAELPAPAPPSTPSSPSSSSSSSSSSSGNVYTVKVGDTMSAIAAKHGHPNEVAVLIKANPQIEDPSRIYPGDKLNIPGGWVALGGSSSMPTPPPKAEQYTNPLPPWYIEGTNPDLYQLPDGSYETFPGEAYQAKVPAEVWARTQTSLAAWNNAYPGECTPADYGQPGDFTAVWDSRTQQALASYQMWANATKGKELRTDGVLDEETDACLAGTFAEILKGQSSPSVPGVPQVPGLPSLPSSPSVPGIPQVPGLPSSPSVPGVPQVPGGPKATPQNGNAGGLLLVMLPLAAAFLG